MASPNLKTTPLYPFELVKWVKPGSKLRILWQGRVAEAVATELTVYDGRRGNRVALVEFLVPEEWREALAYWTDGFGRVRGGSHCRATSYGFTVGARGSRRPLLFIQSAELQESPVEWPK